MIDVASNIGVEDVLSSFNARSCAFPYLGLDIFWAYVEVKDMIIVSLLLNDGEGIGFLEAWLC